jgi:FkbM family methyltransferase
MARFAMFLIWLLPLPIFGDVQCSSEGVLSNSCAQDKGDDASVMLQSKVGIDATESGDLWSELPNLLYTPPSSFQPTSPKLFQDSFGSSIQFSKESAEHSRLVKWIKPDAKVLEVGTRYGSSSCVISWIQKNSGQLVSVEGDSTVWEANVGNMKRLNCKNKAWHGFVSRKHWKKSKTKNGSEWTTKFEVTDNADEANVPSTTFDDVQRKTGIVFDTFLIDCEGCFDNFLQEFPDAVDRVQTILLEADYGIGWQRSGYADYSRVTKFLQGKGFALKENELVQDAPLEGDGKIYFHVFERPL